MSDQVLAAINRVTGNFQTAFNPQIIKSYAAGDISYLKRLITQASKLSFGLVLLAVVPLFTDTHFILSLWLNHVPEYLDSLVKIVVIYVLIDCLSGPFVTVIYAVGKLKRYQITISCIILFNLLIAVILVYSQLPLYVVVFARVSSTFLLLFYRMKIVSDVINYDIRGYVLNVLMKLSIVAVISFLSAYWIDIFLPDTYVGLLTLTLLSSLFVLILFYSFVLSKDEKNFCIQKGKKFTVKFLIDFKVRT